MNKWDDRYKQVEDAFGRGANSFLKAQLEHDRIDSRIDSRLKHYLTDKSDKTKVLCIAAGQGRNALYLAELGFEVTALDISTIGLEQCAETAKERGLSIATLCGSIEDIDLEHEQWDIITCFFMHAPLESRLELYKKVPDALKVGGHFVFECFRIEQLDMKAQNEGSIGGPSTPELFPSIDELSSQLESLDIVHLVETVRELEPSPFHKGKAAVIQAIAQKPKATTT